MDIVDINTKKVQCEICHGTGKYHYWSLEPVWYFFFLTMQPRIKGSICPGGCGGRGWKYVSKQEET